MKIINKINIFSTKSVNTISVIISIIIFFSLNFFLTNKKEFNSNEINSSKIILQKKDNNEVDNNNVDEQILEEHTDNEDLETLNWYVEIPSIYLKAPIKETTNIEILKKNVGHFEETPKTNGNIGLAAHNRGYEKNYFENVHKLKLGEIIKYKYNNFEKEYVIDKIEIIKNTNWRFLENTKENKITLITCVENKPDYRRCIQATEKK